MNTITGKLYKSGNSYSVRIPMGIVKYLGLQEGKSVEIDNIRPATSTSDIALPLPIDMLRNTLQRHGVIKASVFGSYARGEARPNSDLDLLVQLAPGKTYLDLGGLQYTLEQVTGRKVDIATKLNKHFAPYAEKDMVEVL